MRSHGFKIAAIILLRVDCREIISTLWSLPVTLFRFPPHKQSPEALWAFPCWPFALCRKIAIRAYQVSWLPGIPRGDFDKRRILIFLFLLLCPIRTATHWLQELKYNFQKTFCFRLFGVCPGRAKSKMITRCLLYCNPSVVLPNIPVQSESVV